MKLKILAAVLGFLVAFVADAASASAQTANVAGSWSLAVDVEGNVTTPSMTVTQDGEAITGHYTSATLGEADFEGTVTGSQVAFSFQANLDAQGQSVPVDVTYNLTLNPDGTLTGTIDLGGLASGSVRGTRQ